MRREVLLAAVNRLLNDFYSTGLDQMFEEATERYHQGNKEDKPIVSFAVFQKLAVAASKYGEAELEVAKILGLDALFVPETWQRLAASSDPPQVFEFRRNLHFARNDLPKILQLFRQEFVQEAKGGGPLPRELEGRSAITFVLPEDDHEYSTPGRLIAALDAITNIYSVFCTLDNQSETELIVLACDSGSDKSFDFLGLAKIMEQVRKFVMAIWDRRVFYRHMHASQCINLIAESLPVIEKIEELRKQKALEPEQAEILKRKTLQGATMFLESGIYIDEMGQEGIHSPRALMRPEPKLLAAPITLPSSTISEEQSKIDKPTTSSDLSRSSLSAEEAAVLEHLLAKAKLSNPDNIPKPVKRPPKRKLKADT